MSKRNIKGLGSIRQRKDGRYEYRYTHNKKRYSVFAKTKKELTEKIKNINANIVGGKHLDNSNVTLGQLYQYILTEKYNNNVIGKNSYNNGLLMLNTLERLHFKNIVIKQINKNDLIDFWALVASKNYSNSTINKLNVIINMVLNRAVNDNIITINLNKGVILPRNKTIKNNIKALTTEEQKHFIELLEYEPYKLQCLIALYGGLRCGEINALQVKDIDTKNNIININKTISKGLDGGAVVSSTTKTKNGVRSVPIIKQLQHDLYSYINNLEKNNGVDTYLFLNKKGGYISTSKMSEWLNYFNKKHNITSIALSFHKLRHTFATRCIEGGVDAVVLSRILGHASISTTLDIYTNIFNDFKTENIKKLENYINF